MGAAGAAACHSTLGREHAGSVRVMRTLPGCLAAQIEKHWTEKKLDEMTERDWRIFREDFNISYKGSNTVLPMRNWEEAKLPKEIMKVRRAARAGASVHCIARLWRLAETKGRVHDARDKPGPVLRTA